MPTAWVATARRAPFMSAIAQRMRPKRRLPTSSAGVFVYWISQVGEEWYAELVLDAAYAHGLVALHEEHRQSARVLGALFAAGEDEVDVGVAVGDEALDAVDAPLSVGVLSRAALHGTQIGAGVGLGEDHGPEDLSAREAGEDARFHGLVAEFVMVEAISWRPKMVMRPPSARETISIMA